MSGTCTHTHIHTQQPLAYARSGSRRGRKRKGGKGRKEGAISWELALIHLCGCTGLREPSCTLSRALISGQNRAFISTVLMSIWVMSTRPFLPHPLLLFQATLTLTSLLCLPSKLTIARVLGIKKRERVEKRGWLKSGWRIAQVNKGEGCFFFF